MLNVLRWNNPMKSAGGDEAPLPILVSATSPSAKSEFLGVKPHVLRYRAGIHATETGKTSGQPAPTNITKSCWFAASANCSQTRFSSISGARNRLDDGVFRLNRQDFGTPTRCPGLRTQQQSIIAVCGYGRGAFSGIIRPSCRGVAQPGSLHEVLRGREFESRRPTRMNQTLRPIFRIGLFWGRMAI